MFDWSLVLPTLTLAVGGISILLGLVIVRENPRNKLNWVLASMLILGGAGAVLGAGDFAISLEEPKLLQDEAGLLGRAAALWEFIFPTFLLFALLFPAARTPVRRFSPIQWLIFLPHVTHLALALVGSPGPGNWTLEVVGENLPAIAPLLGRLELAIELMYRLNAALFSFVNVSYMVIAIALLRSELKRPLHERLRGQLMAMLAGMGGCFALYTLAEPLPALFGLSVPPVTRTGLIVAGMAVASLSIAYSIVRYRFLDSKIIARRTILYAVSSGILLGLYLTLVHGLHEPVARFFSIDPQVVETAFLVVALMLFQPIAGRLEDGLENLLLRDRGDHRQVLRKMAHEVSTVLEVDELGRRVILMLESSVMMDRATFLVRRDSGEIPFDVIASFGVKIEPAAWMLGFPVDSWSFGELPSVETVLLGETIRPPADVDRMTVVPLTHGNILRGLLLLGTKQTGGGFNPEERALIGTLGSQMGMAVRNAELHLESLDRHLLEEELRFARRVQQSFLPDILPDYPPIDVAAVNLPSKLVGGDYVDAVPIGDDALIVAIGDVSGKGVPAALLMSMTRAALRTQAKQQQSPAVILRSMNSLIHESTSSTEFVTFFLARIDRSNLTLRYSNGGHDRPLLLRGDGRIESLDAGGLILGAISDTEFDEGEVVLEEGDLLVAYTDGLTEAVRAVDGEMFGAERLEEAIAGMGRELCARDVLERLVSTCHEWIGGGDPDDDMTLLVVRVNGAVMGASGPAEVGGNGRSPADRVGEGGSV